MRNKRRSSVTRSIYAIAIVFGLSCATTAFATNGYLIHGVGASAKSLAGACVALPMDALAAASNPAGMVSVGERYDVGVALFSPDRQYTVAGDPSALPGTFGLAPGTVQSDSELFVVPNFGANWMLGDSSSIGLAVYGQGGMNTDFPVSTFHGSSPTGVDLSQMFIVPTYARKLDDRHSLGVSAVLAIQTFEAQGLEAFGGFSSNPARLTNNGHDESFGFGARLGYLGQWTDRLSFGASYQSKIDMDELDNYAGLFAGRGDFDIPANASIGIAFGIRPSTTLVLEVQEIFYSDVDAVGLPLMPNIMSAPLGANGGAGFGWRDMTVAKAGVQWQSGESWVWRFGVSTAEQPIPESEVLFNILAPGVMEEHLAFGFTRDLRQRRGGINFALTYAPSSSVLGPNPLEAPGMQTIELEMQQWDLEVGYSFGIQ